MWTASGTERAGKERVHPSEETLRKGMRGTTVHSIVVHFDKAAKPLVV